MRNIEKLLEIMASLRNPETGCPWDLEQRFASIAPYTVEEAYEVADAIAREDWADLRSELGDLLFQVVFHARLAEEQGLFDFAAVVDGISDKLTRRHPHVFGTAEERARGPVEGSWETIKAAERAGRDSGSQKSRLDDVPLALPALKRAGKLGKRAASVGFDWPDRAGVRQKVDEELAELDEALAEDDPAHILEEYGDLLFALVNLGRFLPSDAETALRAATAKFETRFRRLEAALVAEGGSIHDTPFDELEARWQAAKRAPEGEEPR